MLVLGLYEHYQHLNEQIKQLNKRIREYVRQSEGAQRLETIPGVGFHTAGRLIAEIGNASRFDKGRDLERQQRRQLQAIFDVEDDIIERRDALIDGLEQRLK